MYDMQLSFGNVVFVIAAVFSIVVSALFIWDRLFLSENNPYDGVSLRDRATSQEASDLGPLSDLETLLASQLKRSLSSSNCSGAQLIHLEASGQLTPAEQTNSGFTGYFLGGRAELELGGSILQVTISGTGKGPAAKSNALAMAADNLLASIANESSFGVYCDN